MKRLVLLLILLPTFVLAQEAVPEAPVDPNATIHVVQEGENLFRIAEQYGIPLEALAEVNGISNPDNVMLGQRLLIPLGVPVAAAPSPQTHIVRPGETLQAIADVYGTDPAALASLNAITNPNLLAVGQTLTISAEPLSVEQQAEMSVRHTVQAGETLFRIAQQYNLTLAELQAANSITDPSRIQAGQELILPGVMPNQPQLNLPAALTGIDITPLILAEGKTGRVRITTARAASVAVSFLGRTLPTITEADGQYLMWAAVPLGTQPGIYPLALTITDAAGVTEYAVNVQINPGGYDQVPITLPDDKLDLLAKPVEDNELQILQNLMSGFTPQSYFDRPMSLPAAAPMNEAYGQLRSYNGGPFDRWHNGADFAGVPGAPIYAAASGRVVAADMFNIRGTSVIIDHGWGIYTNYSHMNDRYVNLGDVVQVGQTIGTVGSSGRATGAHLHWELWVNGVAVDPLQWVYQAFP